MAIGTYTPPPLANHYTKIFSNFFFFFFHFRCILLQISHKKCFFISVSILGRSGVNDFNKVFSKLLCIVNKSSYEKEQLKLH